MSTTYKWCLFVGGIINNNRLRVPLPEPSYIYLPVTGVPEGHDITTLGLGSHYRYTFDDSQGCYIYSGQVFGRDLVRRTYEDKVGY